MFLFLDVCFRVTGVFEGSASASERTNALQRELAELDRKENALDDLIQSSTNQLRELTENKDNQPYPFSPICVCLNIICRRPFVCMWMTECVFESVYLNQINVHAMQSLDLNSHPHLDMWHIRTFGPYRACRSRQWLQSKLLLRPSWRSQRYLRWVSGLHLNPSFRSSTNHLSTLSSSSLEPIPVSLLPGS